MRLRRAFVDQIPARMLGAFAALFTAIWSLLAW